MFKQKELPYKIELYYRSKNASIGMTQSFCTLEEAKTMIFNFWLKL